MKVDWVSSVKGEIKGNSLGYGLANKRLKEAFSKVADLDENSNVALHFCHPQHYEPDFGKFNVLYTMCEHEWLSDDFYKAFARCDMVITPSEYCKTIFEEAGCVVPVYVSPLGVDTKLFKLKKRKWKKNRGKPFRFLYLGAPNVRKYSLLEGLYKDIIMDMPGVELYIKTTGADLQGMDNGTNIVKSGNWTLDNRKVSEKELVKIYHEAHCKLFPHMGEGFGMTALESLSTGLPLIISDYASTKEFCNNENSYPVLCNPGVVDAMIEEQDGSEVRKGKIVKVDTMIPDKASMYEAVFNVLKNYGKAIDKGIQGRADSMKLTWEDAAKKLLETLQRIDSPTS